MCFVFQWYQFLALINVHFFLEHIINNDPQISKISKYFFHVQKWVYQTLGGGSVETWDIELEDKVL